MVRYYEFSEKVQTVSAQLTWSHYIELMPIDNINEVNYYVQLSIKNNLSVRQLKERIKSKEYERLPENTRNKLKFNNKASIKDLIKNPILIKNSNNYDEISEKLLQKNNTRRSSFFYEVTWRRFLLYR